MKILITGASGFLGSSLCNMLSAQHVVYAIARSKLPASQRITMVEQDLTEEFNFSKLPTQIDVIIHLAQSRDYRNFPKDMAMMHAVNIHATTRLLEYGRKIGVKQFIYASTGSIYGTSPDQQIENASIDPVSPYAITKYCSELLIKPYSDIFTTTILRLFFLYGPGQTGMMIPNIINRISSGEKVLLQNDKDGMIFCPSFVDDVAQVFTRALELNIGGVYNVASPKSISIREMGDSIATNLGVQANYQNEKIGTPVVFKPNLEKIKKWINLDDTFRSFSDGIAETMKPI